MLLQSVSSYYLSSILSLSACTSASLGGLPGEEAQTIMSVPPVAKPLSGHSCINYPLVVFTECGSSESCPTESAEFHTYSTLTSWLEETLSLRIRVFSLFADLLAWRSQNDYTEAVSLGLLKSLLSLFADDVILYIENPTDSTKKWLKLIN